MKNGKLVIAFDVDDCLLIPSIATGLPLDTPNYETIAIYQWFKSQGYYIVIWSGGGIDYATRWAEKFGLQPDEVMIKKREIDEKSDPVVDICFDDCAVNLAKVNLRVKRLNNNISREGWNDHDFFNCSCIDGGIKDGITSVGTYGGNYQKCLKCGGRIWS
jgi:hypothetical protein